MLKEILQRPVIYDANRVGPRQQDGTGEQPPFFHYRTGSHLAKAVERKGRGIDALAHRISCMGPDGRYPGTPGDTSNIAIEGDLSDAHSCHIGDGIPWSRLQMSWRDTEIAYAGHGMFLL